MDSNSTPLVMGKNRSRTEIMATIITLAQDGKSEAEITEKARLNSKQLKRYLNKLTKLDLIEAKHVNGKTVYVTSQAGNQFLKQYSTLRKFLV